MNGVRTMTFPCLICFVLGNCIKNCDRKGKKCWRFTVEWAYWDSKSGCGSADSNTKTSLLSSKFRSRKIRIWIFQSSKRRSAWSCAWKKKMCSSCSSISINLIQSVSQALHSFSSLALTWKQSPMKWIPSKSKEFRYGNTWSTRPFWMRSFPFSLKRRNRSSPSSLLIRDTSTP